MKFSCSPAEMGRLHLSDTRRRIGPDPLCTPARPGGSTGGVTPTLVGVGGCSGEAGMMGRVMGVVGVVGMLPDTAAAAAATAAMATADAA